MEPCPSQVSFATQRVTFTVLPARAALPATEWCSSSAPNWVCSHGPCATNQLVGFIEVNLARLVEPGQVNASFEWRLQGFALRAIDLVDEYLRRARRPSLWQMGLFTFKAMGSAATTYMPKTR